MLPVTIRMMLREDVPEVCRIDRQCFPEPWSADTFESESTSGVGYYRVACSGGAVVGYIGSHMIEDEAHVTTFGVEPGLRRRRVGERLLADVLQRAVLCGCRRITLEVRESNEGAKSLYRRYGFVPVSRRPRYYTDNDEDAIVMWIEDTSRFGFRMLLDERVTDLNKLLPG